MLIRTALAQETTAINPIAGSNIQDLGDIFGLVINIAIGVGVALTVIYLILGGIQYILSKGDQKAAQQAREWLTNSIIGFIVILGAFTIRNIVGRLVGLEDVASVETQTNINISN